MVLEELDEKGVQMNQLDPICVLLFFVFIQDFRKHLTAPFSMLLTGCL